MNWIKYINQEDNKFRLEVIDEMLDFIDNYANEIGEFNNMACVMLEKLYKHENYDSLNEKEIIHVLEDLDTAKDLFTEMFKFIFNYMEDFNVKKEEVYGRLMIKLIEIRDTLTATHANAPKVLFSNRLLLFHKRIERLMNSIIKEQTNICIELTRELGTILCNVRKSELEQISIRKLREYSKELEEEEIDIQKIVKKNYYTSDELEKLAKDNGFVFDRMNGTSHKIYKHKLTGKIVPIPIHSKNIGRGLMLSIQTQIKTRSII